MPDETPDSLPSDEELGLCPFCKESLNEDGFCECGGEE